MENSSSNECSHLEQAVGRAVRLSYCTAYSSQRYTLLQSTSGIVTEDGISAAMESCNRPTNRVELQKLAARDFLTLRRRCIGHCALVHGALAATTGPLHLCVPYFEV
jgi:hypothetical protein